jgi:hypothetical protein
MQTEWHLITVSFMCDDSLREAYPANNPLYDDTSQRPPVNGIRVLSALDDLW